MKVYYRMLCNHSKHVCVAIVAILIICACICSLHTLQKTINTCILLNDIRLHYSDTDFSLRNGLFLSSGQLLEKNNNHIVIKPDSISHTIDLSLMFQSDQLYGEKVVLDFDVFSKNKVNINVMLKQYSNSREIVNETFFFNYKNHNSIKIDFFHNDSTLTYVFNFKMACDDIVLLKNINVRIDDTIINKMFVYNCSGYEYNKSRGFTKIELNDCGDAVNKLYLICKIWGFLKYYHPSVNQGHYDWDEELLNIINKTIDIEESECFQEALWEWINSLNYNIITYPKVNDKELLLYEKDFSWINSNLLEERMSQKLMQILQMSRNYKYNYYINPRLSKCLFYEREARHENMNYSDLSTRLLSFFRFWNFIEYCYPYRSLINDWDECLVTYLPKFIDSNDKSEFLKQLTSVCSKIKDSHFGVLSKDMPVSFGVKRYRLFIDVKATTNDNYLVYKSWHPDIKTGDLILKINDISIADLADSLASYTSASNRKSLLKKVSSTIFSSDLPEMCISMMRNNQIVTKKIHLNISQYNVSDYIKIDINKLLSQGILYIKASSKVNYIENYFPASLASIKGLILDLRSYPSENMFNYLLSKFSCAKSDFAFSFYNSSLCPGFYRLIEKSNTGGYFNNNISDFSGKIVVIVDENTVSHGEFLCMAVQCMPDCVVIGSQSAGAIGNTSILQLPGNLSIKYTKIATCYPDLTPVQQVGVKIDYNLELDRNSLMRHEDNLINFAVKIINNE